MQGAKLAQPGAVRALRCQLARHNPFYSSTPDEGDLPPPVRTPAPAGLWCIAPPSRLWDGMAQLWCNEMPTASHLAGVILL